MEEILEKKYIGNGLELLKWGSEGEWLEEIPVFLK